MRPRARLQMRRPARPPPTALRRRQCRVLPRQTIIPAKTNRRHHRPNNPLLKLQQRQRHQHLPSQVAAPAPAPPFTPHNPPTSEDICRAIEQDAAENQLPVEFFARVIWQESRFNAQAVSAKGAQGIAQFMPSTADYRGLVDPFDPIEALKNSASYLHDLKAQFGNLGLAAAGL